jgi:hypothetical protein
MSEKTNATTSLAILEDKPIREVCSKVLALSAQQPVDIYFTGVFEQIDNGIELLAVEEPILVDQVWPTEFVIKLIGSYEWSVRPVKPRNKQIAVIVSGSQPVNNRFEVVPKGQKPSKGTPASIDVQAIWPEWYERMLATKAVDEAEAEFKKVVATGDMEEAKKALTTLNEAVKVLEELEAKAAAAIASAATAEEVAKATKEQEKATKAQEKAARKAAKEQAATLLKSDLGRALLMKRSNDLDKALAACSDLNAKIVAAAEAMDINQLSALKAQKPQVEADYEAAQLNITQEALIKALTNPEAVQAELDEAKKPTKQVSEPTEEGIGQPTEQTSEPTEQTSEPTEQTSKPTTQTEDVVATAKPKRSSKKAQA